MFFIFPTQLCLRSSFIQPQSQVNIFLLSAHLEAPLAFALFNRNSISSYKSLVWRSHRVNIHFTSLPLIWAHMTACDVTSMNIKHQTKQKKLVTQSLGWSIYSVYLWVKNWCFLTVCSLFCVFFWHLNTSAYIQQFSLYRLQHLLLIFLIILFHWNKLGF